MAFILRKIEHKDVKGFWRALDAVAREGKFLLNTQAPAETQVAEFIHNVVDNDYPAVFAEEDGEIIGWADMLPSQRASMEHCASLGMGVLQEHRGKGVGEALLTQVMELAEQQGVTRMELEVFANNFSAIALYQKLGFTLEGTKIKAVNLNGQFLDMHAMAKVSSTMQT